MDRGPARRDGVHWVVVDGDVVLVDPLTAGIHVLSGATAATWQLIDGESLDGLAELVADEFEMEPAAARADLAESIAQLRAIGVID